jgi:hypothetical protein
MRTLGIAALVVLGTLGGSRLSAGQEVRGFVGGGTASVDSHSYPSFGGGVLVNAGQPWVSVGAQGDGFVSLPYVVGRGALFAQGNLVPKGRIRPFVVAGYGFGAFEGAMVGGGLEIRPKGSGLGFRGSVENYRESYRGLRGSSATNHLTVRLGVLFD